MQSGGLRAEEIRKEHPPPRMQGSSPAETGSVMLKAEGGSWPVAQGWPVAVEVVLPAPLPTSCLPELWVATTTRLFSDRLQLCLPPAPAAGGMGPAPALWQECRDWNTAYGAVFSPPPFPWQCWDTEDLGQQ